MTFEASGPLACVIAVTVFVRPSPSRQHATHVTSEQLLGVRTRGARVTTVDVLFVLEDV